MNQLTKEISNLRWTLVFAGLCGLVITLIMDSKWAAGMYDQSHPVVQMSGKLIYRGENEIHIQLSGKKFRACKYVGQQAISITKGIIKDAYLTRLDSPETGQTRPVGEIAPQLWKIVPVTAAADRIRVTVTHDCGPGRLVQAVTADVDLTTKQ